MTQNQAGSSDPRRGILGKVTGEVYRLLMVELAFVAAALPGLVGILLLDRSPGNIPLYALCAIPLAPAFSAAISTLEDRSADGDQSVWPRFWRAWVRNVRDVLWVWIPAVGISAILGLNIAFGAAAGVDGFFVGASVVVLVAVALWAGHAVVIATLFRFRARDVARLALYYLAARPLVTLGTLSYLILGTAIVAFTSDLVLVALGVFFAAFAAVNARPMIRDIGARFVDGGEAVDDGLTVR